MQSVFVPQSQEGLSVGVFCLFMDIMKSIRVVILSIMIVMIFTCRLSLCHLLDGWQVHECSTLTKCLFFKRISCFVPTEPLSCVSDLVGTSEAVLIMLRCNPDLSLYGADWRLSPDPAHNKPSIGGGLGFIETGSWESGWEDSCRSAVVFCGPEPGETDTSWVPCSAAKLTAWFHCLTQHYLKSWRVTSCSVGFQFQLVPAQHVNDTKSQLMKSGRWLMLFHMRQMKSTMSLWLLTCSVVVIV